MRDHQALRLNWCLENTPLSDDWKKYVGSINDLEGVAGYNFLNNIPTDIQEIIESNTDISKLLNLPKA